MRRLKDGTTVSQCISAISEDLRKPKRLLETLRREFDKKSGPLDFCLMLETMDRLELYGEKISTLFDRACENNPAMIAIYMSAARAEKEARGLVTALANPRINHSTTQNKDALADLTDEYLALRNTKGKDCNIFDFGAMFKIGDLN